MCHRWKNTGWRDKTLQAEAHAIGSVPACTAEGVVPASTIREKHAKGSVPACRITDKNLETPVRKGTHSRSHAMAFDELSGAEEQDSEEAKVRRTPSLARGSIPPPALQIAGWATPRVTAQLLSWQERGSL